MRTLFTVIRTLIVLVVLVGLAGITFIYSGIYDVSASTPDNPYIAWVIHKTSDASVGARLGANKVPPGLDRPEMLSAGAKLFVENCVVCHGAPGVARTHIAEGLNPQPPDLFRASRKPDEQENFQFIHNGVKMTAMPAFGATEGDEHVWQLVAFLDKLPGISAADYATLTTGSVPVTAPAPATK
jgi:mono/diheme cytochrome c family protein